MGSNAVAFLRRVLPEAGWYCAWTKIGERKYNQFFPTIEALAAHIATEYAQGKTVYHACATFVEPTNRTQANAWGARSLWLDIDVAKHNSPYATAVDAIGRLADFVSALQLPRPLVVHSGSGLHAYWPLRGALNPGDWWRYAAGLKAACAQSGFHVDPSRTTDISSILRTPGTHNRKGVHPLPVAVIGPEGIGPYDVEAFSHLLEFSTSRVDHVSVQPVDDSASSLTRALIVEPDYAPVYADQVANSCAQLGLLRSTQGRTPEPHWYACLGVLSRCADGEDKAHEWSSGHPDYSEEETQAKFERTLALTGATTCAKFESVNATGCAGCPLRGTITSPIAARAGRGSVVGAANSPALPTHSAVVDTVNENATLPLLPQPFAWSSTSSLICVTERGEVSVDVLISSFPIFLVGVGVGEVRHDRFSLHFRQWHPHAGWTDLYIAAGALMGASGGSEMASRGANIHDYKLFLAYVRAAVDQFHATERLKMHYDQCGWKDGGAAFLAGNALYHANGVDENVTVSQELSTRAQWIGPQGGSLEGWSGAANALFAAGCEAQSFALACAFAAPLMRLQASDEGGAVVNLLSRGSGTGKTTALAAIYSAWGRKQGLSLTKIDTRVSKGITLGVLGNLPVVYDELGNRDPHVVREFIAMFTEGRDKMRGHADGSIQHTQANWQTILISGSNSSVHDLLAATGGAEALAFRVLEFACSLPNNVEPAKGDRLRKDMEANAGFAGDAYLAYLLQPDVLAWTRQHLEKWTAELWTRAGNHPEHRFWVRTIGAVAVASSLVNAAGILEFKPNRIIEWAMDQLWQIGGTSHSTEEVTQRAVSTFADFLNEHIATILVVRDAFRPHNTQVPIRMPQQKLYMRYETNTQRLYVSERAFRDWLTKKEIGSREVIDALRRIGLVYNPRRSITLSAGTDMPGAQQICLDIDARHPALNGVLALVPHAANVNVA